MKEKEIDFLKYADNVYTTAKYIVAQRFKVMEDLIGNESIVVFDYFYKRNEERNKNYSKLFLKDSRVTGGRISYPISKRHYIS